MNKHQHRFYRLRSDPDQAARTEKQLDPAFEFWAPSWRRPLPPGGISAKFWVWFLFDRLGVFRSRGYSVLLIRDGRRVIHRSCVFPRFFRFPFMGVGDLQIGDVWTDGAARGRGIATAALAAICRRFEGAAIVLWYLVDEENVASIRVAEKAGFELVGLGEKHPRLGVPFFGYYSIDKPESSAPGGPPSLNGR